MGSSKASAASIVLLLSLNLVLFTLVSSENLPSLTASCPRGKIIDLNLCANVLNLLTIKVDPKSQCCTQIAGLATADAAVCLCSALKLNFLGIPLVELPLEARLKLLLGHCGKDTTTFNCP